MKPIKFEQLLFTEDKFCFSLYLKAMQHQTEENFFAFWQSLLEVVRENEDVLRFILENDKAILKCLKANPKKNHGFFYSEHEAGYISFDHATENFFTLSDSFHMRPLMEELFHDPEYALLTLSSGEVKFFLGDSKQVELMEIIKFADTFKSASLTMGFLSESQMMSHKQVRWLKYVADQFMQKSSLSRLPVLITGDQESTTVFKKFFQTRSPEYYLEANYSHLSGSELMHYTYDFKHKVLEIQTDEMKNRLKNWIQDGRLCLDLNQLIELISQDKIDKLYLPLNTKLWGKINWEKCEFEIYDRPKPGLEDILDDLAEMVIKQGGSIHFLSPHFFHEKTMAMGLKKQGKYASLRLSKL
jgi:hypothetical protein